MSELEENCQSVKPAKKPKSTEISSLVVFPFLRERANNHSAMKFEDIDRNAVK